MSRYLSWCVTGHRGDIAGAIMSWLRQDGQQVDNARTVERYSPPATAWLPTPRRNQTLAIAAHSRILKRMEYATHEAELLMESELLTPTVKAPRSTSFALTSRDLDIIYSVGTYKYLSIFQLQRLHFPFTQSYRAASNRIAALVSAGLLSRVLPSPETNRPHWPPCLNSLSTSENLATLATLLARMSRASLFDRFHDITTTNRDEFAYSFIMHELGISDLYIALELSDRPTPLFSGSAPARKWKA